jgi:hypothetical protein
MPMSLVWTTGTQIIDSAYGFLKYIELGKGKNTPPKHLPEEKDIPPCQERLFYSFQLNLISPKLQLQYCTLSIFFPSLLFLLVSLAFYTIWLT